MARDLGLEQLPAALLQPREGPRLVAFHHRGIANDVGGKDGGELAVHECFVPGRARERGAC